MGTVTGLGDTSVPTLSPMGGVGLYRSHLSYSGAIWAKVDRYTFIPDERLIKVVSSDYLYIQKITKFRF